MAREANVVVEDRKFATELRLSLHEAMEQGAFGNDMMAVEFRKDVLGPMLEELQKQQAGGDVGLQVVEQLPIAGAGHWQI